VTAPNGALGDCLNPGSEDRKEKCCHWPRAVADKAALGATPKGYTGKPGRAKRPYFTGLSRSHFMVAEREGFEPPTGSVTRARIFRKCRVPKFCVSWHGSGWAAASSANLERTAKVSYPRPRDHPDHCTASSFPALQPLLGLALSRRRIARSFESMLIFAWSGGPNGASDQPFLRVFHR
jgi:hypothetical protein